MATGNYLSGQAITENSNKAIVKSKFLKTAKSKSEVLYEQQAIPSMEPGILSQEFMDNPPNSCLAADDFVVPSNEDWIIETITVSGELIGPGMVQMVNLSIYMDEFGQPGPELVFFPGIYVFPDPSGNIEILVPGAPPLPQGTYWLSVQPALESFMGEWHWQKQMTPTILSELVWQNPGGGLGGPPFWEPGSIIWSGMGYNDWDLSFTLMGIKNIFNPPPFIADFYPPDCYPGENIYLYGTDFGPFGPDSYIEIDAMVYHEDDWWWENDTIVFELPNIPAGDSINLRILNGMDISNEIRLGFNFPDTAYIMEPSERQIIYWDTLHISVVPESFEDHIDSSYFYYRLKGEMNWNFLGVDTCGENIRMSTYYPMGEGDGWAWDWDLNLIQTDTFEIRTELFDKFGYILTGETSVVIDKTPPIPFIEDTSKLISSKSIENDSIILYYTIQNNNVGNVILCNQNFFHFGERDLDSLSQWDLDLVINGDSFDDDACAPVAGASCLKWLAENNNSGSNLDNKTMKDLAGDLVRSSGTKNNKGTTAGGIRNGMQREYRRGTGKSLKTGVYPNEKMRTDKIKLKDKMLKKFDNNWDVLLEIRQKMKNGKTKSHFVTLSSYHSTTNLYFDDETGKYVSTSFTMVDFMDPADGETVWAIMSDDDPPKLTYDIDADSAQNSAYVAKVVTAKPRSGSKTGNKTSPLNYIATIPVPGTGTGTYRYAIASSDMAEGIVMFHMFAMSATGDTLADYYVSSYNAAYRPYAFFEANQQYGKPPFNVQFTNNSTPIDSITYFKWNFGDGDTSNLENPSHAYSSNGIYDVSLIVSDGDIYDTIMRENYIYVGTALDLTVFLEGPYENGAMKTDLNPELIPLEQPYDISPWNYSGSEEVDTLENESVVDWLLVELRETLYTADSAGSSQAVVRQAAFLLNTGQVVSYDRAGPLYFDLEITDNLFVALYHRNHLPIMSAIPLPLVDQVYTYDFTDDVNHAFGGENGMVQLAPTIWGKIAGDANADGEVNNPDKDDHWLIDNGTSGYLGSDFNMDGQVNDLDIQFKWEPNTGKGTQVPE